MLYHGATLLRDHINTPDAGLYVAFQILSKMVTINHLREGGKERTKSEMLGRVRMVMTGGLEQLVAEMVREASDAAAAKREREAAARLRA